MQNSVAAAAARTPLNREQIIGFWAAWAGWMLDGMDSVIYALVLSPALDRAAAEVRHARRTPAHVGFAGSMLFALFLVGWGMSFIWGPIADRFGRTRALAATDPDLRGVHRRGGAGAERLAAGAVPLPGRHRHRRRMGDGRHLCRRSLARGPPQDGRGLSADRLLRRLLRGRRAELHGRREPLAGARCSCAGWRRSSVAIATLLRVQGAGALGARARREMARTARRPAA